MNFQLKMFDECITNGFKKNYIDTSFTRDHWIIDVMKYETL